MRLNVHVPDELIAAVRERLPQLNVSAVLQGALRDRLDCRHEQLACAACSVEIDRWQLRDDFLAAFYCDVFLELRHLADRGGTAEGAARVVKDIGQRHQVSVADRIPLPRPTRAQRIANKVADLPRETDSRAHHPTARRTA